MNESPPIKFLLVDDLEENLLALEGLLRRDGLDLLKAKSGKEALEILLRHEIALAFIDVQMPSMSGLELADIMRSTERTRHTPIIFLTAGNADHERWNRGYDAGAIDFLPKPIDTVMLHNKASVFFELAEQRRDLQENERKLREMNDKLEWINSELEESSRKKDQFIAMLAHELRNPLAPILTGMEVLRENPHDPELIERIAGMLDRHVNQITRLIDDLMDVSRMTTGKIQLKKGTVRISDILQQSIETMEQQIKDSKLELVVSNTCPDLRLNADHHRLAQVISNLLSNAVNHTQQGGRIDLSVKGGGGKVTLTVSDNGAGIDPADQERIFKLFDQGASGSKGGLGIGLKLVKSIVEMHDGTIALHSAGKGHGSEFTVTLPVGTVERQPEVAETPTARSTDADFRVLVADDVETNADIIGMFFQLEGLDCKVVYDGAAAVAEAKRSAPRLACFDLGMPVMDGYEAARKVREICPGAYIVALSGWGAEADRLRSREAGFDEHLVKPVKPDDLRALIDRICSADIATPNGKA